MQLMTMANAVAAQSGIENGDLLPVLNRLGLALHAVDVLLLDQLPQSR